MLSAYFICGSNPALILILLSAACVIVPVVAYFSLRESKRKFLFFSLTPVVLMTVTTLGLYWQNRSLAESALEKVAAESRAEANVEMEMEIRECTKSGMPALAVGVSLTAVFGGLVFRKR
jgi:hypothetical protein